MHLEIDNPVVEVVCTTKKINLSKTREEKKINCSLVKKAKKNYFAFFQLPENLPTSKRTKFKFLLLIHTFGSSF